ncbi:MAG: Meiotic Sister-Chromatid recombination aldehyde dehydrogenase [Sclerophora amabilis]|nr:MAG: Meiotic Sister-Chromatid recombination aldehyde dehydrogenase [Sclerophora amabilis]
MLQAAGDIVEYFLKPFAELNGTQIIGLAVALLVTAIGISYLKGDDEGAVVFSVEKPVQCHPDWVDEVLEDPQLKVPGSSAIQCYCPANGKLLGTVNSASPAAIDRAVEKATEAQRGWAKTSFGQRRRVLQTLLRYILDNQETVSLAACLDSGKTRIDSSFGEILVTAEKLRWTILHGERALKAERRPTNFLMAYKVNEVRWEPLGVVAACVSWNYPLHNLLGPVISAIFAGNGIVVKASEATAWSSVYFTRIVRSALQACGHSPNLVQSITCWPSVAPHLTSHPGISHITFIGSRNVARAVASSSAQSLIPVCMELGGKDAAIILDDVSNIEQVASILMRGVFQSAGQNCIGIERVIACDGIYARLAEIIEPRVRALRVGSALDDTDDIEGVDVGAMISSRDFDRLERLISDAVSRGAQCLVGGTQYNHPKHARGHYFSPTLLTDVTSDMAIAREETFAPIFLLMRASNVDDAIRLANSTEYGLGASVFGRNQRDLDKVVASSRTGMVSVNDFAVYYAVQLPFGGVRGSGYGRFAGLEGLRSLSNTKSVCRDRFPRLLSTAIPKPLDYPIASAAGAWDMCRGVVELGYGQTVWRRAVGLARIVRVGVFGGGGGGGGTRR